MVLTVITLASSHTLSPCHRDMRFHRIILPYGSFYWLATFLTAFAVTGPGTNPVSGAAEIHIQRRHTQEELNIPSCGEVLSTLETDELRDLLDDLVQTNLGLSGPELLAFQAAILTEVDYGVKVVKVCAKCSDYIGLSEGVCEAQDYAIDVAHSG